MLACAESDSAQANTARSHLFCEYLRENEFLSKTILACFLGAQMASIHEIKNDKKSRDTAPLRLRIIFLQMYQVVKPLFQEEHWK